VYGDFLSLAAKARKTTPEKIDEVAQGRVWTGLQAKDRNLVDRIGSYGDALASAASAPIWAPTTASPTWSRKPRTWTA
jgi:protease-4